jgi:hypothetical protein
MIMSSSEKTLNDRPHPGPLPRGEGTATVRFALCRKSSGKSSRRLFRETVSDSPSLVRLRLWLRRDRVEAQRRRRGEGRGEGERNH